MLDRAGIAEELGAFDAWQGCDRIFALTSELLSRGHREIAERAWNANCRDMQVRQGIFDSGFESVRAQNTIPFGWNLRRSGDVSIRVEEDKDGGSSLVMRNNGPITARVLQAIDLAPGTYRLRAEVEGGGSNDLVASSDPVPIRPILGICREASPAMGRWFRSAQSDRQQLALWLRSGSRTCRSMRSAWSGWLILAP